MNDRKRSGFTLAEVLVTIVLGSVVAGALYQVLVYQNRFYAHERAAAVRHDALRTARAILATDLMEASGSEGDFGSLTADSVSLRSPVGFGVVCAVDSINGILSLIDVSGRIEASGGDSLLVYHPNGWLVRAASQAGTGIGTSSCAYANGYSVERAVVTSGITGVPIGAPVRAFHRYTYSRQQDGISWWLARTDGSGTQVLAGPFSSDSSGLHFVFRDQNGQPTTNAARVAWLDLMMVAKVAAFDRRDTLVASIRPRNQ